MKRNAMLILVIVIIFLVASGFLSLYFYKETETVSNFLVGDKHTAILEQVSKQESINEKLDKISNEKNILLTMLMLK